MTPSEAVKLLELYAELLDSEPKKQALRDCLAVLRSALEKGAEDTRLLETTLLRGWQVTRLPEGSESNYIVLTRDQRRRLGSGDTPRAALRAAIEREGGGDAI